MNILSMKDLLEAGVHFGHQIRKWNPKMKNFIYTKRNGIHIINLKATMQKAEIAYQFIFESASQGKTILFVGTKKQNQQTVEEYAKACGIYYITYRWLGGILTNFKTIQKSIFKLKEMEVFEKSEEFLFLTKKEILQKKRKKEKLEKILSGIKDMDKLPDMIFVVDVVKEFIAVQEANKLGIPIIGIVDSNADPTLIDYPIPGNDDAIRSTSLFIKLISKAYDEGRQVYLNKNLKEMVNTPGDEANEEDIKAFREQFPMDASNKNQSTIARNDMDDEELGYK